MTRLLSFLLFTVVVGASNLPLTNNHQSALLDDEKNSIEIYNKANHSVVNVTNIQLARSFWDYGTVEIPRGQGTGFIWDEMGHIVTNYHVIEGGNAFLVSFYNDSENYEAKIVGAEPLKDIAVLKVQRKPKNLTPITIGQSSNLQVGQKVLAIGNPFGFDHTMTKGIISAMGRKMDGHGGVKIYDMIQTDASINPGNSGGPLLNSKGEIIGVNAMIYSQSGSSSGLGFAIPIDTIKRIVPQLIKYGKVIRPGLGIGFLPQETQRRLGIKQGLVIAYVTPNGPAKLAGLQGIGQDEEGQYFLGDIILEINQTKINSPDDLYNYLDELKIGDQVKILYQRNHKKFTTQASLTPVNE